jgi:hypothetical protein
MTIEDPIDEGVGKEYHTSCPLLNSAMAKPSTTAAIILVSRDATSWEVI